MPDPIFDKNALDGNWYDSMAGEDEARIEVLKEYKSADDFYNSHQTMVKANWRDPIAGDDADFGKQLERFDSPAAFGASFKTAQDKISSGKMKDDLPAADADEPTVKAYREANGIPLEAAGYLKDLPDGVVLGEDDMPIAEVFMGALHSVHAPPAYAHALIGAYNAWSEEQQEAQNTLDVEQAKATTDTLRESWKGDYRANINLAGAFLENTFGKEFKQQLLEGRLADGRAFMNAPEMLEGLAQAQRKLDPLTQILPPGGDPEKTLNDEIAEIEKFMREHRTAYNKDEGKSNRLRDLYQLRIDHEKTTKVA